MDPILAFAFMLTPFGALIALGLWQLASVSRAKKRRVAREQAHA